MFEAIVDLVGNSRTAEGLRVKAKLDSLLAAVPPPLAAADNADRAAEVQ